MIQPLSSRLKEVFTDSDLQVLRTALSFYQHIVIGDDELNFTLEERALEYRRVCCLILSVDKATACPYEEHGGTDY
jgi:hypothetical protein